jgi:hypothetical protein
LWPPAVSLLLSIAAAVTSAGSAAGARRFAVGAGSSGAVIEAITASRRSVANVSSPNRSGVEPVASLGKAWP